MKVQDLKDLFPGDTFRVAGLPLVVDSKDFASRSDGRRFFWGRACASGADLYGMEVTDVVRKRERVTLTFEVLRDDDVIQLNDMTRMPKTVNSGNYFCEAPAKLVADKKTVQEARAHGWTDVFLREVK